MKTKALVLSVFAMFLFSGIFAQVVNIPDKAKDDFAKKHANARDVNWDNKVTYYIVHYTKDGVAAIAHYRLDGTGDFTDGA